MSQSRPLSAQERQIVLEVKLALRRPHEGPNAIPRKKVWMQLGISEALFSRWLNPDEPEFPSLLDLRRIHAITMDPAPLVTFLSWYGEGYDLATMGPGHDVAPVEPLKLMTDTAIVDAGLELRLAQDLADGRLTPEEAIATLPAARARARQAMSLVENLERLSATRVPA